MNTSNNNCFFIFLISLLAGIAGFLLSFLNVFTLTYAVRFLTLAAIIGVGMAAVFFYTLTNTEKTRLIRDAVCCCGKLTAIGFTGTTVVAFMTLLLFNTTTRVLFDLGIAFVFFFLTMLLAGLGCIITMIYQCGHHNNC